MIGKMNLMNSANRASRISQYETKYDDALFFAPEEALYLNEQGHTLFKINKQAEQNYHVGASVLYKGQKDREDSLLNSARDFGFSENNEYIQAVKNSLGALTYEGLESGKGTTNEIADHILGEKELEAYRDAKGMANPYSIARLGDATMGTGKLSPLIESLRNPGKSLMSSFSEGLTSGLTFGAYDRWAAPERTRQLLSGEVSPAGTGSAFARGAGKIGGAIGSTALLGLAASGAGLGPASAYLASVVGGHHKAMSLLAYTMAGAPQIAAFSMYNVAEKHVMGIYNDMTKRQVMEDGGWELTKNTLLYSAFGGLGHVFKHPAVQRAAEKAKNFLLPAASTTANVLATPALLGTAGTAIGGFAGGIEGLVRGDKTVGEGIVERGGQLGSLGALGGFPLAYWSGRNPQYYQHLFKSSRRAAVAGMKEEQKVADALFKVKKLGFTDEDIARLASIVGPTNNHHLNQKNVVMWISRTVDDAITSMNRRLVEGGHKPLDPSEFKVKYFIQYFQNRVKQRSEQIQGLQDKLSTNYVGKRAGFPTYTVGLFKDKITQAFNKSKTIPPTVKRKVLKDFYTKYDAILNPKVERFGLNYTKASVRMLRRKLSNSYAKVFSGLIKTDARMKDYNLLERIDKDSGRIFDKIMTQVKKRPFQHEKELQIFVQENLKKLYPVFSPNPQKTVEFLKMAQKDVMSTIMGNANARRAVFRNRPRRTAASGTNVKDIQLLLRDLGAKVNKEGLIDAQARGATKEVAGYKYLLKNIFNLHDDMIKKDYGPAGELFLESAKRLNKDIQRVSVFLNAAEHKGLGVSQGIRNIMENSLLRYRVGQQTGVPGAGMASYLGWQPQKNVLQLGGDEFLKTTFLERFERLRKGLDPSVSFDVEKHLWPKNFVEKPLELLQNISFKINGRQATFETIKRGLRNKFPYELTESGEWALRKHLSKAALRVGTFKDLEEAERHIKRRAIKEEYYPDE